MKIRTRLYIILACAIASLAWFFVASLIIIASISSGIEKNEVSRDIIKSVFEPNLVRSDYQIYYEERAYEQWQRRYRSLVHMLEENRDLYSSETEQAYFSGILTRLDRMRDFFGRLQKKFGREINITLRGQLLEQSQECVVLVTRLARHSHEQMVASVKMFIVAVMLFLVNAFLLIVWANRWVVTKIISPIKDLQAGVKRISAGNFSYRTDLQSRDELGYLSRAFDAMTAHLAKSYEQLTDELEARTRAEVKLRRFNEELEERVQQRTVELKELNASLADEVMRRRQAEAALTAVNEELEERVRERTALAERRAAKLRELASALTVAEQKERRRLAQILHDHLQQMLVAAKISLARVSHEAKGRNIETHVQQVQELLDESIAASRSFTVELSPPVLHDAGFGPAMEWLARWMEEKHELLVEVDTGEETMLLTDDVKIFLFQAVREVLFNVVKHAETNRASVRLMAKKDRIVIMVEDRGRGFDLESLERGEGGFGLFNIRERLEMLGGRLQIESAVGKGSRFTLEAPAQAAEAEAVGRGRGERKRPKEGRSHAIRVMVVDDHRILRQGLVNMLASNEEIEIVGEAGDGEEAVSKAGELLPQVIIMDITMPRMNGIEATRRIRDQFPDIRIIGLSLHDSADVNELMRQAGASAYHTKSGPIDDLVMTIHQVCHPAPAPS